LNLRVPGTLGGNNWIDAAGYIVGAPELLVEISRSSRSFGLNQKKTDYERAGVAEYVVIEIDPNRIHWFVRRGDHFEEMPPRPDGIYRSEVFPGLWLDPAAFFAADLQRLNEVLEQGVRTPEHEAFVAKLAAARSSASQTS
jgi:Uma2 family endonuclease